MQFRTEFPPFQGGLAISHSDKALCVGSCFSEHMGARLARYKFPVFINPFGIVYNPVSIAGMLKFLLSEAVFREEDLFCWQGLWHSYQHHGQFSRADRAKALEGMNQRLAEAREFLRQATRLIITPGTATVFQLKKTGETVANCHKVPGQEFQRRRLDVAEVRDALLDAFRLLRERLPGLQIILSVSPVRHVRDGLVENQRSKAVLLLALEQVAEQLAGVHYFPSYEIVMDDLRDYRYYEQDMVHPGPQAVEYIWRYFERAYFDASTRELCRRVGQLVDAAAHRPLHPGSSPHLDFVSQQLLAMDQLERDFPFLSFDPERKKLSSY